MKYSEKQILEWKSKAQKWDELHPLPKIGKFKEKYVVILSSWNWTEHPYLSILDMDGNRIKDDFVNIEMNGEIKNGITYGSLPKESKYSKVLSTVSKKDVTYIDEFYGTNLYS